MKGLNSYPYWVRAAVGLAFFCAAVAFNIHGSPILGLMALIVTIGLIMPNRQNTN